jgi:hypothetical protein
MLHVSPPPYSNRGSRSPAPQGPSRVTNTPEKGTCHTPHHMLLTPLPPFSRGTWHTPHHMLHVSPPPCNTRAPHTPQGPSRVAKHALERHLAHLSPYAARRLTPLSMLGVAHACLLDGDGGKLMHTMAAWEALRQTLRQRGRPCDRPTGGPAAAREALWHARTPQEVKTYCIRLRFSDNTQEP